MNEPWRYRCPNGHVSVRPHSRTPGYYCNTCSGSFDHIIDAKTGKEVQA